MEFISLKNCLILECLHELFPESSSNTLRSWIKAGRIKIDGKLIVKATTPLKKNAVVTVGPKLSFLKQGIKVLFEDDDLIVIEKPEGLLSVATDFDQSTSVHDILKKRFHTKRVFPVHRLDRETSGVMIFTYNNYARKHLKDQFENHSIEKIYYAIVEGKVSISKGTWESYLQEDAFYSVSSTLDIEKGKLAITHFEEVSTRKNSTLLRLKPVTGKKHQLRVHCKEASHPVIGDKRYGTGTDPIERLCLHAQTIVFTHPTSGKKMRFEIPIPLSFEKLIHIPKM